MGSNFIVGLDIGTSSVKAALAEKQGNRIILHRTFKESSAGLRKGAVSDLGEAVPAVSRIFEEIRKISKSALKNVYVNIGTPQVKIQASKGIVAVSRVDNEIYQDDIDRVVKASQAVQLAPNRMVVHTITREFIVDGVGDIPSPIGLSGGRLEVVSMIVDAFAPHVKSIMRLVEMAGGEIGGLVFNPIAASRAVLSKHMKELGVVVVDIGCGTTSVAVYEENKLLGLQIFPVGGGNITNDIAVGLKIPVSAAEKIKLHYGYAIAREVGSKESIDLQKFVPETKGSASRRFVSEIIESRLAEILEFVNNELKLISKVRGLAGGIILTGGTAKLPGLAELAKDELRLTSQIGFADISPWISERSHMVEDAVEDPEFSVALGLVLGGGDEEKWWEGRRSFQIGAGIKNINLKKFFRNFLPE
jgi:cell division protein FtsA